MNKDVVVMRPDKAFKDGPIDLINKNFYDNDNLIALQIGSYAGQSTQLFLSTGKIKQIYCVDPWENGYDSQDIASQTNDKAQQLFDKRHGNNSKVIKCKGYSYDIVKDFSDSFFDFIYVDGNHQEQAVQTDLRLCLPKLKSTGVLAGHDYNWKDGRLPGVTRAVNRVLQRTPQYTFSDYSWSCHKQALQQKSDRCLFCIISSGYQKQYKIMLQSFLKYNKDWDIILFYPGKIDIPGVTKQIDITQDLKEYPVHYDLKARIWSYRAAATLRCLQNYKLVLYCDSDMYFYNKVPQTQQTSFTLHNNHTYSERWYNICCRDGFINTGFYLAVPDEASKHWFSFIADIYKKGAAVNAIYQPHRNIVWDQKIYFSLPFIFPEVYNLIRHDGINVAQWNLCQRNISKKDGIFYSNDVPLICFHFSAQNILLKHFPYKSEALNQLIVKYKQNLHNE